jgi:hypothetical protein
MDTNGIRKTALGLMLAALIFVLVPRAAAQQAATAGSTSPTAGYIEDWNEIGHKLIAMAEDFPEDKYDFKPNPEVRSFAEQMLHVSGSIYYFEALLKGQKAPEDPKRSEFKSKADIVAYVKKAVASGTDLLRTFGDAAFSKPLQIGKRSVNPHYFWADFCEHAGEHYGQMVVYYRVNNLVPPESRPKK